MRKLFLLLCGLPLAALAQEKGIQFTHASSWDEVVQKARTDKKMIFVDAYTTWCGPCKYLSKEVFTQDKVGKYFNDHFVSVKMQLDTTDKDDEHVKQWYPMSSRMMHTLKINAFPTLLFFDENGNPVHRFTGASDGDKLVASAAKALNPDNQFYTLQKRYEAGARDEQTLLNFSNAALMAFQPEAASKAFTDYMDATGNQVTKENAQLVYYMANSPSDRAFEVIARDPKGFDAVYGKAGAAEERLSGALYEKVLNILNETKGGNRSAEMLIALKKQYPTLADRAETRGWMYYAKNNGDWKKFTESAEKYMKQWGSKVDAAEKNELAWAYFEHIEDKARLNTALAWSKASLVANDPNFMDTYANLLHKLGRTQEAIEVETKAMAMASEKESYKANIDKMKKGQKTW